MPRNKSPRLIIEPIPASTWGISLANKMPPDEWHKTRKKAMLKANYTCQGCGSKNVVLDTHEVWGFIWITKIQRLIGFQVLCKLCHDSSHMLRSLKTYTADYIEVLKSHICKVNKWTRDILEQEITEASRKSYERSKGTWKVFVKGKELR